MPVRPVRTTRHGGRAGKALLVFIHDPPKPQTRKELKVNLPTHQHQTLRQLQVVTGLETPTLVSQALNLYFAKLAAEAAKTGRN